MSVNVDLVRSIYAAWERGGLSMADWAHPEIEFVRADGPALGSGRGLADLEKVGRDFLDAFEDYRYVVDE
jgi:hypothetical protein